MALEPYRGGSGPQSLSPTLKSWAVGAAALGALAASSIAIGRAVWRRGKAPDVAPAEPLPGGMLVRSLRVVVIEEWFSARDER